MTYKKIIFFAILATSVFANVYLSLYYKGNNGRTFKEDLGRRFRHMMQTQDDPAEMICYYHRCNTIQRMELATANGDVAALPQKLIVAPGIYSMNGKIIDMQREGLYRLIVLGQKNYQVIVYKNDLEALLGSLSWIVTHGNKDNRLGYDQLVEKAGEDKLYLTCGHVSSFAVSVLTGLGYSARTTLGISKGKHNSYDDEHMQCEVFHPQLNRWILVDLDNNLFFEDAATGQLLNLVETKQDLDNNCISLHYIANDAFADVSGFSDDGGYSYAFFAESLKSDSAKIAWYKRVLGFVTIGSYYYDKAVASLVKGIPSNFSYMDSNAFYRKFYGVPVVMQ